jgi:hypothetical protein
VAELILVSPMTPQRKTKLLLWISRGVLAVSILALVLIHPLCYCSGYYVALSVAGIVPLVCGPRLYRWLGSVYIFAAMLLAVVEHRAALDQVEQIRHIRAEAHAQHP